MACGFQHLDLLWTQCCPPLGSVGVLGDSSYFTSEIHMLLSSIRFITLHAGAIPMSWQLDLMLSVHCFGGLPLGLWPGILPSCWFQHCLTWNLWWCYFYSQYGDKVVHALHTKRFWGYWYFGRRNQFLILIGHSEKVEISATFKSIAGKPLAWGDSSDQLPS